MEPTALGAPRWLSPRRALRDTAQRILPGSVITWHGPRNLPRVALTFDDGPATMTRAYLDELDRVGARATFFVVGQMCALRRDDLLDMVRRGHEVAGHGYVHERFPSMTRDGMRLELDRTAALLPPAPRARRLVRPPHGAVSLRSLAGCAAAGYTTVLWSFDSDDCRTESSDAVAARVVREARSGDIVLLHEEQRWTLDAIGRIVIGLEARGFELVTVSELLSYGGDTPHPEPRVGR